MSSFLIISIMADDRPGLVETLSSIVNEHKGNWLESRLTHLAGKFAGIVHLQVGKSHVEALQNALQALQQDGWTINIERSQVQSTQATSPSQMQLSIVGNDRPGIVKEVSQVLAKLKVNVLDLTTHFESAAMTAEALFKTKARVQLPENLDEDDVRDKLEELSNDLMVEVKSL